ncbi:MAG: hypothetical protein MJ230_07125 [bacterium]|nr:hypothetical protein [bacterium]
MKVNSNAQTDAYVNEIKSTNNEEPKSEIKIFGDTNGNILLEKEEFFNYGELNSIDVNDKKAAWDDEVKRNLALINTCIRMRNTSGDDENIQLKGDDIQEINNMIDELKNKFLEKCNNCKNSKPSFGLVENSDEQTHQLDEGENDKPLTKSARQFLDDCKNKKSSRFKIGNNVLETKNGEIFLNNEKITYEKAKNMLENYSQELLDEFGDSARSFFE